MINTNKVRGRIVEKGLTQENVAKSIGIVQSTLSQKINNKRPMSLSEAKKLAEILSLSQEEIVEFLFF